MEIPAGIQPQHGIHILPVNAFDVLISRSRGLGMDSMPVMIQKGGATVKAAGSN